MGWFCLQPANPGWGVGCVCLGAGFAFRAPILTGACCLCVWVWVLPSRRQSLLAFLVCVFAPSLPILALVWHVCVCVGVPPVPHQSWLKLVVCLFGYAFWVHPANPGWGVRCGCLCVRPAFNLAILAWVCCACILVRVVPSSRESWLGFVVFVFWCGFCLQPADSGWDVG